MISRAKDINHYFSAVAEIVWFKRRTSLTCVADIFAFWYFRPLKGKPSCLLQHFSYLLQQLAQLSALGISGAQALFWCHHCADTAAISILGWAVHLPAFLGANGLRVGNTAVHCNGGKYQLFDCISTYVVFKRDFVSCMIANCNVTLQLWSWLFPSGFSQ